ncbi:MAG: hypothetical protein JST08_14425 [Actinobacteria bacterium]|nr:hypothetical protein [Actinomycetota bacterium]
MRIARAAPFCLLALAVGIVLVSGGSDSGPRTPQALPGLPPPFLGTAVSGDGGLTAAVDAYGDVVDLRPGPAGPPLIHNPSDRQAAGTVPAGTGIVPRLGGRAMWEADQVTQRYLPGTNVVRTVAWFDQAPVVMEVAATGNSLAMTIRTPVRHARSGPMRVAAPSLGVDVEGGISCARERRPRLLALVCGRGQGAPPAPAAEHLIATAATAARRWLARSRPLDPTPAAPRWTRALYERSLLTIHALSSRATGAVAAGGRDGWAYVWPRDAATAALALEASGHRAEARDVARFLTGLNLAAAARFTEAGAPVPGRAAQGDARGWVAAAARATGIPVPDEPFAWRDRADYQESTPGTYLGNALAATALHVAEKGARIAHEFGTRSGLVRIAGDPGSGLDSAAAWAVRPFRLKPLYPAAARTLLRLTAQGTPYGITPSENWVGGNDPWTAPTAWSAWALAALANDRRSGGRDPLSHEQRGGSFGSPSRRTLRQAALRLLTDLHRASTPAGDLPERVGIHTGIPTSTTPLLWSSAFTVLALRELWP